MKTFLVYTVNHSILPFTGDELNHNEYFSRTRFIHTRFDITQIWQRLIPDKKYWLWIGFSKSCRYFLNANKNWFTVISLIAFNCSWIISRPGNIILSLKLLLLLHNLKKTANKEQDMLLLSYSSKQWNTTCLQNINKQQAEYL